MPGFSALAIWLIAGLSLAGVMLRPWRWPEAVWALAGAALLVALGLVTPDAAAAAMGKGLDVYLFLAGMMLLSETARREGLFDRVAALAVAGAQGSPRKLFLLVYLTGIVITAFLSNDATAVVLTPAVYAAARRANLEPLPYLFICALIANAASFLLPISNPANIVLYGDHTPPLAAWLSAFALPSLVSILLTYGLLFWREGRHLPAHCARPAILPPMPAGAWGALAGIVLTAVVLLTVSALDRPLGAPTCVMGALTAAAASLAGRARPADLLRGVSWQVLLLVAGLFVLVQGVNQTGLTTHLAAELARWSRHAGGGLGAGFAIALASNLINNLPAGLIASGAIAQVHPPQHIVDALLLGVDLGPNLSVTGSLATILWLAMIRREGEHVGFRRFLGLGLVAMPPTLAAALLARLLT